MKRFNKYIIILILLSTFATTLILFIACNDSPNEPEEPPPGSRDYTWEVDTLVAPFWTANRMWASSPEDVWVIGDGGSCNEQVFHYDGKEWEKVNHCFFSPGAIHGFAKDNIWIGGQEGHLYQYNGIWWSEKYIYSKGTNNYVTFSDIWGESPDDMYAIGVAFMGTEQLKRAFILHYDGTIWEEIYFAEENSYFLRIMKQNNSYYIWDMPPQTVEENEKFNILKYNGESIENLYTEISGGYYNMKVINKKIYVTINKDIYNIENYKLVKVFTVNEENFGHVVYGRNKNDLFFRMRNGISHYNGADTKTLIDWGEKRIDLNEDGEIFDKTAFFSTNDFSNGKNYVFRFNLIK